MIDDYLDENSRLDDEDGLIDGLMELHPLDIARIHERLTNEVLGFDSLSSRIASRERAEWLLDVLSDSE